MTAKKKPKVDPQIDSWMVIANVVDNLSERFDATNERLRHLEQVQMNICMQCGEFLNVLAKIEVNIASRCNHQDVQLDKLIDLMRRHVEHVDQLARNVTEKSIRRDLKTPTLDINATTEFVRTPIKGWS